MSMVSAQQIAEAALFATGHRTITPELVEWVTQLVELVRRIDREDR